MLLRGATYIKKQYKFDPIKSKKAIHKKLIGVLFRFNCVSDFIWTILRSDKIVNHLFRIRKVLALDKRWILYVIWNTHDGDSMQCASRYVWIDEAYPYPFPMNVAKQRWIHEVLCWRIENGIITLWTSIFTLFRLNGHGQCMEHFISTMESIQAMLGLTNECATEMLSQLNRNECQLTSSIETNKSIFLFR